MEIEIGIYRDKDKILYTSKMIKTLSPRKITKLRTRYLPRVGRRLIILTDTMSRNMDTMISIPRISRVTSSRLKKEPIFLYGD